MKADPATLTFTKSVLDGLSIKERETFLAPYFPHSSPTPSTAVQRDLLDTKSACEYLGGASRSTLWRMERDGELKAVWVRGKKLFRLEDLNNALRGGKDK